MEWSWMSGLLIAGALATSSTCGRKRSSTSRPIPGEIAAENNSTTLFPLPLELMDAPGVKTAFGRKAA